MSESETPPSPSGRPPLEELVGELPAEERDRLRRVHELLIAVGRPPELPPRLAGWPAARRLPGARVPRRWTPRRRLAASLALAAATSATAFGAGYLAAAGTEQSPPAEGGRFAAERVVTLRPTSPRLRATAVVQVGKRESGNLPLRLTVRGLGRLPLGDYYILYMTKGRKPVVTCGTFNVRGSSERSALEFTVAYDLAGFDGFALVEYRRDGHRERTLMTGKLT